MKKQLQITMLLLMVTALSGCLMTRNEIEEVEQRKVVQQQVSTLQRTNADAQSKFNEVNDDIRGLNGRVEALENRLLNVQKEKEKSQQLSDQQLAETNKKVLLLQEEIQKLEGQVAFLNQEILKIGSSGSSTTSPVAGKKEESYHRGEESMNKKEWRQAILHFQKYREVYPKGKRYPQATYKIGQSFLELGMKEEAKTFFEEVVVKFPDNQLAKLAKDRLKKIR